MALVTLRNKNHYVSQQVQITEYFDQNYIILIKIFQKLHKSQTINNLHPNT